MGTLHLRFADLLGSVFPRMLTPFSSRMDSTRAESREVTPQLAAEVMTAEETYTMHLRLYRGLVAECLDWVPVELPFEGREAKAILDPGVDKLILYPRQERLRFQLNHLAGIRTEAHLRLEDLHAGAKL